MAELVAQVFYQVDDGLQGQEEAAGEGYGAAQAVTDTEGQEEQGFLYFLYISSNF